MKKIILWILFLILLLVTLGAFGVKQSRNHEEEKREEVITHFQERMTTLGIEDIGMPIEGFDANLLIMAYPGLVPADFQDVETIEGRYDVKGSEVVFVRGQGSSITSAERMISELGYETLLKNVSTRLGVSMENVEDIDNLIEKINTAERVEVKLGQTASALGFEVRPTEILEDSRCPVDVVCIQAGTVRVRADIVSAVGQGSKIFDLEKPAIIDNWEVTLIQVAPVPESTVERKDGDYVFYFRISTRVN